MKRLKNFILFLLAYCALAAAAAAQDVQFLPEVDFHLTVNSRWRVYLQTKDDREGGASNQFLIGPSVQLYLKPLVKLQNVTSFDLDDAKKRFFVLEAGYRSITVPNAAPTNRMETIATFSVPLGAGFLMLDRNRADLNWQNGGLTWRYHNRVWVQHAVGGHAYHFTPYVAAEPYYYSQYGKWSTTALYAGVLLPVGKVVQFNPYYEHENNTGKTPNKPTNSLGLIANFFFSLHNTH